MPALEVIVRRREFVMPGVEGIFKHPEQIKIHEARPVAEQEIMVHHHFLEGNQTLLQFFEPAFLFRAPLVNAAAAELALFEPQILQLIGGRHVFLVINVIQPKRRAFNFVFDAAPENGLHTFQFGGKQAEVEFLIEIFRDHLRIVAHLEHDVFAVFDDRDTVVTLPGQFPDQGTVLGREVDDFERRAGEFKNAPLGKAKGTPRKLNQFNHVKYSFTAPKEL